MELGFAGPREARPTGVQSASSFSWAQDPERVGVLCEQLGAVEGIIDEYGRVYSGNGFLAMLRANCPLQFTQSIGRVFA
jgi:hypothetical protein